MINNYDKWIFIGKDCIKKDNFNKVKNAQFIKPEGGLWLSPLQGTNSSAWRDFVEYEMDEPTDNLVGTIVDIDKSARILYIDSVKDLVEVVNKYTDTTVPALRTLNILDFEKISEDYDAILLTDKGQAETRFSQPSLYGWDFESMLVMNINIVNVIHSRQLGRR